MAQLGQSTEDDKRTPFQRARLPELHRYCVAKGIKVKGNARKDEILLIISAQGEVSVNDLMPMVSTKSVKASKYEPDLSKGRNQKAKKVKTA